MWNACFVKVLLNWFDSLLFLFEVLKFLCMGVIDEQMIFAIIVKFQHL